MAYCAYCGKQIPDEAKFCAYCGKATSKAAAHAPPQTNTPPPIAHYGLSQPVSLPRKRNLTWVWGVAGAVVIIAVVCVLVFVVLGERSDAANTPEEAVRAFFAAMEKQDADAIIDLLDPNIMEGDLADEFGDEFRKSIRDTIKNQLFMQDSVKFSNLKMKTEMTGEFSAAVTVVEGKVTLKSKDGTEITEDVSEADEPVTFNTVRRDGKWYLDPMSLNW